MIAYLSVLFLVSSNLLSFLLLKSYTVILPIQRNVLVYLTGFIIQSLNCLNSVIVSKQLPQWCRISPFFYIYINSIQLFFFMPSGILLLLLLCSFMLFTFQCILFFGKFLFGPFPANMATMSHLGIFWTCFVTVNSFLIIYCFRADFITKFLKL